MAQFRVLDDEEWNPLFRPDILKLITEPDGSIKLSKLLNREDTKFLYYRYVELWEDTKNFMIIQHPVEAGFYLGILADDRHGGPSGTFKRQYLDNANAAIYVNGIFYDDTLNQYVVTRLRHKEPPEGFFENVADVVKTVTNYINLTDIKDYEWVPLVGGTLEDMAYYFADNLYTDIDNDNFKDLLISLTKQIIIESYVGSSYNYPYYGKEVWIYEKDDNVILSHPLYSTEIKGIAIPEDKISDNINISKYIIPDKEKVVYKFNLD